MTTTQVTSETNVLYDYVVTQTFGDGMVEVSALLNVFVEKDVMVDERPCCKQWVYCVARAHHITGMNLDSTDG